MKKIICIIFITVFFTVSCAYQTPSDSETDSHIDETTTHNTLNSEVEAETMMSDDETGFGAESLAEFEARLKGYGSSAIISAVSSAASEKGNAINSDQALSQAWDTVLDHCYLSFDGYSVYYAGLDSDSTSASEMIELYWHDTTCQDEYNTRCCQFRCHLIYYKNGVSVANATQGYSLRASTEGSYYKKTIGDNKTAYVVLLNDNMYCRFAIDGDCKDYALVESRFLSYCFALNQELN